MDPVAAMLVHLTDNYVVEAGRLGRAVRPVGSLTTVAGLVQAVPGLLLTRDQVAATRRLRYVDSN